MFVLGGVFNIKKIKNIDNKNAFIPFLLINESKFYIKAIINMHFIYLEHYLWRFELYKMF